jgi:hypothetical protein
MPGALGVKRLGRAKECGGVFAAKHGAEQAPPPSATPKRSKKEEESTCATKRVPVIALLFFHIVTICYSPSIFFIP